MPESKGRDHKSTTYTPPPRSKATEPNPTWWAPVFITLLVLGLLWIVVYYVTQQSWPIESIHNWNMAIGFGLIMAGFLLSTRWK